MAVSLAKPSVMDVVAVLDALVIDTGDVVIVLIGVWPVAVPLAHDVLVIDSEAVA